MSGEQGEAMTENRSTCPHCGDRLRKWRVPLDTTWSEPFFLVCFNNDCPYYKSGWRWMKEQYGQEASYRYMLNPATGAASMIPVWDDSAMRELIIEEAEGGEA